MSSFLFLHFCDDALWLLGLYFQLFILSGLSSGGFLPLSSKPPQRPHTPPTGPVWGFGGVVSLPGSQNRTQALTGPSLVFLPRTSLPLPLKGEGRDFAHRWGVGFSLAVACGNCWPQPAHAGPTGRVCCFAGVVPLPCPQTGQKSPYRGQFGFGLLAGASQEDHPPFRQSRVRNRAEEKTPLPLF